MKKREDKKTGSVFRLGSECVSLSNAFVVGPLGLFLVKREAIILMRFNGVNVHKNKTRKHASTNNNACPFY